MHVCLTDRKVEQNNAQQLALRSRPPFTGVLRGPGRKVPPGVLFERFWATGCEYPQKVLFECFLAFFSPKNAKKHSKSTLWGTRRQVPKNTQKALRGALQWPGPLSTPVNGGRDHKTCESMEPFFNFLGVSGPNDSCQGPRRSQAKFKLSEAQRVKRDLGYTIGAKIITLHNVIVSS